MGALVNGLRRRSLLTPSIINSISPSTKSLCRRGAHNTSLQTHPSPSSSSPFESKIRRILRNEIQYHYDYAPPHQPVAQFDRFIVEDRPGEQWITLRGKSADDENIKIEATMFDGSILVPKSEDAEDVRLHISMVVDIWKGERSDHFMEFVCSAWPDCFEIQRVVIFKPPHQQHSPSQPCMGPDIRNLNTQLRNEFYKFLNTRGVNDGLSNFLHKYMINKDRIELIHWLGKVQSYFEN
ncbi:hypothetical protein ACP275_01G000400 [Erythranthe tilingii]